MYTSCITARVSGPSHHTPTGEHSSGSKTVQQGRLSAPSWRGRHGQPWLTTPLEGEEGIWENMAFKKHTLFLQTWFQLNSSLSVGPHLEAPPVSRHMNATVTRPPPRPLCKNKPNLLHSTSATNKLRIPALHLKRPWQWLIGAKGLTFRDWLLNHKWGGKKIKNLSILIWWWSFIWCHNSCSRTAPLWSYIHNVKLKFRVTLKPGE